MLPAVILAEMALVTLVLTLAALAVAASSISSSSTDMMPDFQEDQECRL